MLTCGEFIFIQFCSAKQNVPHSLNSDLVNVSFRNRKNNDSDLANIISGGVKCRWTNCHFSEDIGLSYPPAKDIGTIGGLFALILFIWGKET